MTAIATPSEPQVAEVHHHDHPSFVAHHFESAEQQFDSGKLGIWLFLVTEIMFFSGLFCAYAIFRSNHPEIFVFAHKFLNVDLGAINTVVLLVSSLTMALAVRASQLGQQRVLIINLLLTLACAFGFLGIKYIEYKHKWEAGLLWARDFKPDPAHLHDDHDSHGAEDAAHSSGHEASPLDGMPRNAGIFFSIYFCLTGLHGIHILAGMGAIIWILVRSIRGDFSPEYYGPVDFVGLYWHLVDLIWIYLFPLLYLIH